MDDFGMLARDFGYKPQGKTVPMGSSKPYIGSDVGDRHTRSSSSSSTSSPFIDDHNRDGLLFSDVFGGPPKFTSAKPTATTSNFSSNSNKSSSPLSDFDYDSIFKSSSAANDSKSKQSTTMPVYDKPVYDDEVDIFDGLPGLKSKSASSSVRFDDEVFSSMSSPKQSAPFDDLLGNLGRTEKAGAKNGKSSRGLDDLIPGFGGGSPSGNNRSFSESRQPQKPTVNSSQTNSSEMENPFVVLESTSTPVLSPQESFSDPLEEISKLSNSENRKTNSSSVSGGVFDDIDPLNGFGKSAPSFSSGMNNRGKDASPSRTGAGMSGAHTFAGKESTGNPSFKNNESHSQKKMTVDSFQGSDQTLYDMPSASTDFNKSVGQAGSFPSFGNVNSNETSSRVNMPLRSEENFDTSDDVWLTVSEIPLFTQPTSAPPPSRPPPPRPPRARKPGPGSFASNARKKGSEFSSSPSYTQYSQNPFAQVHPTAKSTMVSQIDELEGFAMGKTQNIDETTEVHSGDEMNTNSAAAASAAMKEAMDRAEAKFRHAKEVREREYTKADRSKEAVQLEKDEQAMQDAQEREFRENQERLDRERHQREKEDDEREQRRLEERERLREKEREREKARQAVERATREARERAAAEARLRAERACVEKASAGARERAERAAVQRAQSEARERAAAGAKERAEKAAAEAKERANAEAREKAAVARAEAEARRRAERAAVERAAAEARERAAAEARERAAGTNQQKNDNDLESFFSMGSRPSSAPRPRATDTASDVQFQSRGGPEGAKRTPSVGVSSNIRKASSTTNIVDDLTSIFGAASSSGDFQDVEGENEDRRRARLERHQRTQERAAKALAEKNQRDLQTQRDQEERHRIAETLDFEIKRWAAGKEGNLRALLSTMQYVLWPECGWQPVSLTDLITGASVKKVYRKATLCIHPDKVQQKGANLQQKYIAEKVFDLLKEAWNKFNSEELF